MRLSDEQIARARERSDIYAKATVLRQHGNWMTGKCPLHADAKPSFGVRNGRWTCFSGCGGGDPIAFLQRWHGLSFEEAVRELAADVPLRGTARPVQPRAAPPQSDDGAVAVREILGGCEPITPTTAAHLYLWSRNLPTRQPGLLAHDGLLCVEQHRALPALVAPITDSRGEVTAVQRIWCRSSFDAEERDSRARLDDRKKTLGVMGNGAVRLAAVNEVMGLAEGVETAIAASGIYGVPVWAACGLSRLGAPEDWRPTPDGKRVKIEQRAPSIWIPPCVRRLVLFGDNGAVGHRSADFAAWFWRKAGLMASAVYPDPRFDDFNSELIG